MYKIERQKVILNGKKQFRNYTKKCLNGRFSNPNVIVISLLKTLLLMRIL